MGNTVITSYIVDSYPLQSMSVITYYSVFLNLSAFANPVTHPLILAGTAGVTSRLTSFCSFSLLLGKQNLGLLGLLLLKGSSPSSHLFRL